MRREQHSILMVDDDVRDRTVVTRALESAGIEVTSVPNRADAIEVLGEHGAYNLAILDVHLPDANGVELCHELSAQYDMPIIMLTAAVDERDAVHALDAGADDYVRKPFHTGELRERVMHLACRTREVRRLAALEEAIALPGAITDLPGLRVAGLSRPALGAISGGGGMLTLSTQEAISRSASSSMRAPMCNPHARRNGA